MSSATMMLTIQSPVENTPIEIDIMEDDHNNRPCGIALTGLGYIASIPATMRDTVLPNVTTNGSGIQRIRVYCSQDDHNGLLVSADGNASASIVGRASRTIRETLSWAGARDAVLRYWYDDPRPTVVDETPFIDVNGATVSRPEWTGHRGIWRAPVEVTGDLVVEYEVSYTIVEVLYQVGVEMTSPQHWSLVRAAWRDGNINDATPPKCKVNIQTGSHIRSVEFDRKYNPVGVPAIYFEEADMHQEFSTTGHTYIAETIEYNGQQVTSQYPSVIVSEDESGRKLTQNITWGSN